MTIPKIITISFLRLNLCPSELSNSITVEICRNTPMTTAFKNAEYIDITSILSAKKVPKGVIKEKSRINKPQYMGFSFDPNKKILRITAIGILCISIP